MAEELLCSSRGCQNNARWALEWRNPKIHSSDRVKTWLACDEHRDHLTWFLRRRDFPCEVRQLPA